MYIIHVNPIRGRSFTQPLKKKEMVIGRSRGCDLVLNDDAISRRHARLYEEDGSWFVEDLQSRNGTLVDELPVLSPTRLTQRNLINLSGNTFSISLAPDANMDSSFYGTGTVIRPVFEILSSATRQEINESDGESLRLYTSRLSLLNEVHSALSKPITSDALLVIILERIFEALAPEEACIFLKGDRERLELAAHKVADGCTFSGIYSQTLIREVCEGGLAAIVSDVATDERFSASTSMVNAGIRSLLAAPLLDAEGSMGMIVLASRMTVRRFTEDDMALLVALSSLATLRIRNLSLVEKASQALQEANAMLERKVAERTAALEKSNLELRSKNEAILHRQNQLILQEKMVSVGTMAAGVAHLIKNPLNFVKNLSEVSSEMVDELLQLLGDTNLNLPTEKHASILEILADLKTNAKIVHNHGVRADQIVISLMEYAREPAKDDRRPVDINSLVEKYTQLALSGRAVEMERFPIKLRHNHNKDVGKVPIFAGDLSRTLIGMINNAVDAIFENAAKKDPDYYGYIETQTRRLGDMVEIVIEDNGCGIDPAHIQHIFTPFFTTKHDDSHIGLGLSIGYDTISQRHQGHLLVSDRAGGGTRISMQLPLNSAS